MINMIWDSDSLTQIERLTKKEWSATVISLSLGLTNDQVKYAKKKIKKLKTADQHAVNADDNVIHLRFKSGTTLVISVI